jgi:hypothetical protein
MNELRPKRQMLMLGSAMIVVSLLILSGNLCVYLDMRNGWATISKDDAANVVRCFLVITTALAAFLLLSARSIFRNRKALKDNQDSA